MDFLVKKTPASRLNKILTLRHGAVSTPAGSLMEPQQNMAKSMAGFLEKPAILFAMFFNLGITTLSNIATKLSFSVWAGGRQSM